MTRSFKDWLAGIVAHYGDLMHFDDIRTVRIMRQQLLGNIQEHDRISRGIEDSAARAEYDEAFAEEINEAKAGIEFLDNWLAQRGLHP